MPENLHQRREVLNYICMAIINSTGVGAGKKSAGVFTYRRVRGRTIASARVQSNKSNTQGQQTQRAVFAFFNRVAKSLNTCIGESFNQTKYGSRRNAFIQANKRAQLWLSDQVREGLIQLDNEKSEYAPLAIILDAVNATGAAKMTAPVFVSHGALLAKSTVLVVTSLLSIDVNIQLSRDFKPGDTVFILYCQHRTDSDGQSAEYTQLFRYDLTQADIAAITLPNMFTVTSDMIPNLYSCRTVPLGYTRKSEAAAAFVKNSGDGTTATTKLVTLTVQ
ncbi:hypothetical protein Barb6_02252 [Bacteroidales bacterium Barb6]|nr:hypothetical protein Barb6_02252 [Bacteroidales bacterium Barb6]